MFYLFLPLTSLCYSVISHPLSLFFSFCVFLSLRLLSPLVLSLQPSELNSVTLVAWLRGRGALVGANHQKEELMPKVVGCLAEA